MQPVLIILIAVTPELAYGSRFRVPSQGPAGHHKGPSSNQKGLLIFFFDRRTVCAERGGASAQGSRRAAHFP